LSHIFAKDSLLTNMPAHLRNWWSRNHVVVLRVAIAVLASYMLLKLGSEFYRLLFDESRLGALDLGHRYWEVQNWFGNLPVYFKSKFATYPPMSYLFFWLALGWAPFGVCRWLWAAICVAALYWLARLVVRESGAGTRLERIFVALLPLSMTATGVAVGNGQISPFLVPVLCTAVLLVTRERELGWGSELAIVMLMLVGLIHPVTASPFFLIVLFAAPRLRPALLIVLGYLVLSFWSASFQPENLPALLYSWVGNVRTGESVSGYADIHLVLHYSGLGNWQYPVSMLSIALFAVWSFVHRRQDPWLLLGVTAIVARLWTYHGLYDDMLFVIPMVTLFRMTKEATKSNRDVMAAVLLGSNVLVMLLPSRMHYIWLPPWPAVFAWAHGIVWAATFVFLLIQAGGERKRQVGKEGLASARHAGTLSCPND